MFIKIEKNKSINYSIKIMELRNILKDRVFLIILVINLLLFSTQFIVDYVDDFFLELLIYVYFFLPLLPFSYFKNPFIHNGTIPTPTFFGTLLSFIIWVLLLYGLVLLIRAIKRKNT